jgi:16S rRNA processing protein RimM
MYRQHTHLALVGKVAGVHGIRGELSVYPLTNAPERFFELARVFVATEDPAGGPPQPRSVESVRVHKGRVLLKLEGLDDRTPAERLVGAEVFILAEERAQLSDGEYFIDALVGLTAEDALGRRLGVVSSVDDIPGNPLLALDTGSRGEVLVPFSRRYVADVDLGLGRIVLTEAFADLLDPLEVDERPARGR